MNQLLFKIKEICSKMWFTCCLYCLFALFSFFVGPALSSYVPNGLKEIVTISGVSDILKILASSMLAVTTFSLSIMVQAYSAAATTATPRANKLIMEDSTAQNALGSFIGAFLFSIVGIIGINSKIYNEDIIIILFIFTIILIVVIIIMLLKWINQLSRLGRVTVTIDLVEEALLNAIKERAKHPFLYANQMRDSIPILKKTMYPIEAGCIGYVQYIDVEALNSIAKKLGITIKVTVNPGKFVDSIDAIAYVNKEISEKNAILIAESFVIGGERTFNQDPRYGFVILSEIALRALSPAINDPGTAIDVLGTYIRSVTYWVQEFGKNDRKDNVTYVKFPNVYIPKISEEDILEDMYMALIKDASNYLTVSIRLKKGLYSIKSLDNKNFSDIIPYWLEYLDTMCGERLEKYEVDRFEKLG